MISFKMALSAAITLGSVFFLYRAARFKSSRLLDALFGIGFLISGGSDLLFESLSNIGIAFDVLGALFLAAAAIKLFFFTDLTTLSAKKN